MKEYKRQTIRQLQKRMREIKNKINAKIDPHVDSIHTDYTISKIRNCEKSPFGICCYDNREWIDEIEVHPVIKIKKKESVNVFSVEM